MADTFSDAVDSTSKKGKGVQKLREASVQTGIPTDPNHIGTTSNADLVTANQADAEPGDPKVNGQDDIPAGEDPSKPHEPADDKGEETKPEESKPEDAASTEEPKPEETPAEPAKPPVDTSQPNMPKVGDVVMAHFSEGFDGHKEAAAFVTGISPDDASLNLKIFAPGGGADRSAAGVYPKNQVEAMEDGPDKNSQMTTTWSPRE